MIDEGDTLAAPAGKRSVRAYLRNLLREEPLEILQEEFVLNVTLQRYVSSAGD